MFDLDDSQKNYVILGLLLAVLLVLISGVFYYYQGQSCSYGNELSTEKAKSKAADYINNNLMGQGQSATIENVTSTGALYKFALKVSGQKYESYMTKDGSLLFPQAYELESKQATSSDQGQNQNKEIPQKETPEVELFVQSFCPYGSQAENTMKPVYDLLGDKVDWKVNFIASEQNGSFSSLHGSKEVTQDKRELCVIENQGLSEWFDFATYVNDNCGSEGACWEDAASKTDLSTASLSSCVEGKGSDLLSEDASVTSERGVSASPTLFVNGVETQAVYEYGNPNAYKEAICSGFEEKPAECEEELESQGNSNSNGGSC